MDYFYEFYRSSSHNDGQNGEKYDLLRCAVARRLDELRREQAGNFVPKQRTNLEASERGRCPLIFLFTMLT